MKLNEIDVVVVGQNEFSAYVENNAGSKLVRSHSWTSSNFLHS